MDPRRHKQGTGKSNQRILKNLERLDQAGIELIIRVPLIPSFNDSVDNIRQTASLASRLVHVKRLDLLPYHRLGKPKYLQLGLKYALEDLLPMKAEQIDNLRQLVESFGLQTTIGG